MNLPNILTVSRIPMTVIFVYFLNLEGLISHSIAAGMFALASITDFFDGYFARKYNLITSFGKIMDPIADKFLVLSAFVVFAFMNFIPIWMFTVIAARELFVTGLRLIAMRHGTVLAAEKLGKVKTVLQIIVISLFLIYIIYADLTQQFSWSQIYVLRFYLVIYPLMFLTVFVTFWSGMSFLWNNAKCIK